MFQRHLVSDWVELLALLQHPKIGSGWYFRGERECDWQLQSTLERAVPDGRSRALAEATIVEHFRQRAANYLPAAHLPVSELEWLALIQHHGGPTRLVEFTESRWIGLFFALEAAPQHSPHSVLWAVNGWWLSRRCLGALAQDATVTAKGAINTLLAMSTDDLTFQKMVSSNKFRTIFDVQPFRKSQRATIQQGHFLCPGDVSLPFLANWPNGDDSAGNLLKIEIPDEVRIQGLQHLREHNLTRATLFPGIDGFAQSLGHVVLFEDEEKVRQRALMNLAGADRQKDVFEVTRQRARQQPQ